MFSYIKFNSSFEGKNQSVYPPNIKSAQILAAIAVSEHPLTITVVLVAPVPTAVPVAPVVILLPLYHCLPEL